MEKVNFSRNRPYANPQKHGSTGQDESPLPRSFCVSYVADEVFAGQRGLHRTYYSGIERGVRNDSLINIERIGRV